MSPDWGLIGGAVGGALIGVLASTLVVCYRVGMKRGDLKSPWWYVQYWFWRAVIYARMRRAGIRRR